MPRTSSDKHAGCRRQVSTQPQPKCHLTDPDWEGPPTGWRRNRFDHPHPAASTTWYFVVCSARRKIHVRCRLGQGLGWIWRRRLSPYTHAMRSVADDLRDELQDEVLRLPFEERIALILRLGERGLEMFRQANGLDRETAIRELQRQRQAG